MPTLPQRLRQFLNSPRGEHDLRNDVIRTVRLAGVPAWVAFGVGSVFLAWIGLFIAGSALADPGGWRGAGLTAAWLVPMIGLAALALLRPSAAVPLLAVLTLLPVGFGAWSLADYDGARHWENSNGPLGLVLLVVVAAGLVTLGLARPTVSGVLLLLASVAPVVLEMISAGGDWPRPLARAFITAPLVAAAMLLLIAGARTRPETGHGTKRKRPRCAPGQTGGPRDYPAH